MRLIYLIGSVLALMGESLKLSLKTQAAMADNLNILNLKYLKGLFKTLTGLFSEKCERQMQKLVLID
jgi:hypothetical protein